MCVFKRAKNSVCRQLKEVPESLAVGAQGPAQKSKQTSWPSWHRHGLSILQNDATFVKMPSSQLKTVCLL